MEPVAHLEEDNDDDDAEETRAKRPIPKVSEEELRAMYGGGGEVDRYGMLFVYID